jgi:putative membrane protein
MSFGRRLPPPPTGQPFRRPRQPPASLEPRRSARPLLSSRTLSELRATTMLSSHPSCWGRASRKMASDDIPHDPRVYLAAERTFLAWIRTGLALMAFGFVVARFGLFLRELEASRSIAPAAPSALSLPLGVGLVLLGVALNLFSSWHHVRYIRELNEGSLTVGQPSRLAIVLALILAAAGLGLALYLGTTRTTGSGPKSMSRELIPFSAGCELGCEGGESRV